MSTILYKNVNFQEKRIYNLYFTEVYKKDSLTFNPSLMCKHTANTNKKKSEIQ